MSESGPEPGDAVPDSVIEALALLEAEGYTESFRISKDGSLQCDARDEVHPLDLAIVDFFYRFEGESNPDDESIVFGLRNPDTGTKGTLVSGFGPSADPEEMDALVVLHRKASGGT